MKKLSFLLSFTLVLFIFNNLSAQKTKMVGGAEMYPSKTIVENASQSKDHTTLVAAVKAANLVGTLSSDGPFTVFAPTDEAFAKLPKGTLESLLKPENKQQLISILTYHVVPGKVMAKDVKSGMVKTASGSSFKLKVSKKGVHVDKAKVVATDVMADNGVIHVIDTVIIPKSK